MMLSLKVASQFLLLAFNTATSLASPIYENILPDHKALQVRNSTTSDISDSAQFRNWCTANEIDLNICGRGVYLTPRTCLAACSCTSLGYVTCRCFGNCSPDTVLTGCTNDHYGGRCQCLRANIGGEEVGLAGNNTAAEGWTARQSIESAKESETTEDESSKGICAF